MGASGSNGLVKTNVYDQGGQLLFSSARQNTSVWTTRFVYLGGKLIAETDANGGTTYSHTDALGSPVARTNAAGQLLSRTRYEPYGLTVAGTTNPGTNGLTALGFTGHVNDPDTGLVHMQQRYYDPLAGRFMSVDPIVTNATTGNGFNRYEYGNNNPYLFVDPDGRASTCSAGMGGCTVYIPSGSGTGSATGVSGGTSTPGRSAAVTTGAVLGGVAAGGVAAGCTAISGGLCGAGAPALVGGGMILGGLFGGAAYDVVDLLSSMMSSLEQGGESNVYAKPPENARDPNGPKAPGKPPGEVGFKDSKGGENWVPNPNPGKGGGSHGWQDANGDVWVPSGQGGRAHGGPHWDVQTPGGGYRNVRPPRP